MSKTFKMPIFPFIFHVYFGDTIEENVKKAYFSTNEDMINYNGFCVEHRNHIHLFFKKGEVKPSTIAHECSHATEAVYRFICSTHNKNEELRAYLTGWINGEVCKALKKLIPKE